MRLDILSDPICPWCMIGKRLLDEALAGRPDHPFQIEWHPFQLNPGMPAEGMDRRAYLRHVHLQQLGVGVPADAGNRLIGINNSAPLQHHVSLE